MAVLLGTGAWWFAGRLKQAKMRSQCSVLAAEIERARQSVGRRFELDSFLEEFEGRGLVDRNHAGELVDVWGTPLEIGEEVVTSAGRDRVFGTEDDDSSSRPRAVPGVRPRMGE
ncbi:hypothetical protein [Haloferula rosea]|uniref:Uncharacterized protein n=1 Tax=Haloferula rosea TaxID=490093 RepID=A0A934VFJ3_9BACT|nr:hypothetical protein [Haloferula rosea]MBK1827116.1 hypothetical protein [Haloferula rosea]